MTDKPDDDFDLQTSLARELLHALEQIAEGRPDRGRPLAAETARQIARQAMVRAGLTW